MAEKNLLTDGINILNASRRNFLRAASTTALGGALGYSVSSGGPIPAAFAQKSEKEKEEKGPAPFIERKNLDALIKHSGRTYETERDFIGTGVVTSNDIFFVRANLPEPPASIVAKPDA
jgi:hypothetical protein